MNLRLPRRLTGILAAACLFGLATEGRAGVDQDSDGMDDNWELANGLDPADPTDASADPDGDGITNVVEFLNGSNPGAVDSDGDGRSDGDELRLGSDPANPSDVALGTAIGSENYRLAAYTFDSGQYAVDGSGQSTIGSESKQLVIASNQQPTPVGASRDALRFGYAGYLYSIQGVASARTQAYAPRCDAGANKTIRANTDGTWPQVTLSGWGVDPGGGAVSYKWRFIDAPNGVTDADLIGATDPTVMFTPAGYGYYTLELTVSTTVASSPCFVIVTAISDELFYYTGPFIAWTPTSKLLAYTTAGGSFPTASSSTSFQLGAVAGDPVPMGTTTGNLTNRTLEAGYLHAAFGLYDAIDNLSPVADAGNDETLVFGGSVTLDGSNSYDPDGPPGQLEYQWSIWQRPTGSEATISNPTSKFASFTPDRSGSYVILLRVNDGDLVSVPDPVIITVSNTPPVAEAGLDQTALLTSPAPTIALDGSASYDPDGQPITYNWKMMARPSGSAATLTGADTATPTFAPDLAGYYRFELTVRDDKLLDSPPDYVIVIVAEPSGNQPPVAGMAQPSVTAGQNWARLDGTASYDPDWDQVAWPDPDPSGVNRKGLAYHWQVAGTCPDTGADCFTSADCATGSCVASRWNIQCSRDPACPETQSPAWTCGNVQQPPFDCPEPIIHFNGENATHLVGLTVIDAARAQSSRVTASVTSSGIADDPPIAVATPPTQAVDFSNPSQRNVTFSGLSSYDPVNANEPLTYQWTLASAPAGSTAQLVNANTARPGLSIDVTGSYEIRLVVTDSTGNASTDSVARVFTHELVEPIQMPNGWPVAGQPGGSGGHMALTLGDDGVYDKPVVVTIGFSGMAAAFGKGSEKGDLGPFGPIVRLLRERGYDVWMVSYTPICSGGSPPNLDGRWAICGQDVPAADCACPYPEQPVDNHISLNAVVLAHAIARAKNYGACATKSADDPTDPCFVRVFGPSMGGVISRLALAWAEDPSKVTVPFAAGESAPYAMNGLRAKPAGQDAWDVGARVFISGDAPQQGANVPPALRALIRAYESNQPDAAASGGPLGNVAFEVSGVQSFFAWALLHSDSTRNYMIDHQDELEDGTFGIKTGFTSIGFAWEILQQLDIVAEGFPWVGLVVGATMGYLEGMAMGWEYGVIGAVINGLYAVVKAAIITALLASGPVGWVVAAIYVVADYFLDFSQYLFKVKSSLEIEDLGSATNLFPFNFTPVLDSPAAKEMLYETVTSVSTCDKIPWLLLGTPVANTWPAGFGKERKGVICDDAPAQTYQTSSSDHDAFYTFLDGVNGNGYPTLTRNVGVAFGSKTPGIDPETEHLLELYLPWIVSNQAYETASHDRDPGSRFGDTLLSAMVPWRTQLRGTLVMKLKALFYSKTKRQKLFEDRAYFPAEALEAGIGWPFIPTASAMDLERANPTCDSSLPCCQMVADGETPVPDGAGQNCCLCTTPFDTAYMPPVSLLHAPELRVNPCVRGQNPNASPAMEQLRAACVSPVQVERDGQAQMCKGDTTWYLTELPNGIACFPSDDALTAATLGIIQQTLAQLDIRPNCPEATASFLCETNGQICPDPASCGCTEAEGRWMWFGGIDRDGDGCPGQHGCGTYCETDTQDLDSTVVGNQPQNNTPPSITSISPQQSFTVPRCRRSASTGGYRCVVDAIDSQQTPLSLSVTASDPDGDPLRYQWTFIPDRAQNQSGTDLAVEPASSATPRVAIQTRDRSPQGTYRVRVTVFDNKGGSDFAETTVVVPGDQQPTITAWGPASVPEICEMDPDAENNDSWRCYAAFELHGTAFDPDSGDGSVAFSYWEHVTDREQTGYTAAVGLDGDGPTSSAGNDVALIVYGSESHIATSEGYPLQFRLTVVDWAGQSTSQVVEVIICPVDGCPEPQSPLNCQQGLHWNSGAGGTAECAESEIPSCTYATTWSTAYQLCAAEGARLCTRDEIQAGAGLGTGCGHETRMLWTDTPCGAAGRWMVVGDYATYTEETCVQDLALTDRTSCDALGWTGGGGGSAACAEADIPTCYTDQSYASAEALCTGLGARLCTRDEIRAGAGKGTGCGHDARMAWTDTPCGTAGRWMVVGDYATHTEEYCEEDLTSTTAPGSARDVGVLCCATHQRDFGVRCCGDDY